MTFLDEKTSRADLVIAAIEAGFEPVKINATTDSELLDMIRDWIEAGDECGAQ
jgi:hypothetical protein